MSDRTRRQHLVSKFYLRGFANDGGQLGRTQLETERSPERTHLIALNNATVQTDFYTVDFGNGPSDVFEKAFAEIEGNAATAWTELAAGRSLGSKAREHAATWIALQYLRSASLRQSAMEANAAMISLLVRINGKQALRGHIENKLGRPITDAQLEAEWTDLIKPGGPTLTPDVAGHLAHILDLLPETAQMIYESPWMMFVGNQQLTTSDHPVYLVRDPEAPSWMGVGLRTAGGMGLAVSRDVGLMILTKDNRGHDFALSGDPAMARLLNAAAVGNARTALYHHPDDKPADWFGDLPKRRARELAPVGEHITSEDGWNPAPVDEQKAQPQSRLEPPIGSGEGFALADVEWPIVGRVFDWSEPD